MRSSGLPSITTASKYWSQNCNFWLFVRWWLPVFKKCDLYQWQYLLEGRRINLFFLPLLWVQIFCTWKNVGPSIHYSRLHFLFPSLFLPITSVSPQLLRLITVRHKPLRLPKLKAAEYSSWGQYSKRWQIGNSLFSSKKKYYSLSDKS